MTLQEIQIPAEVDSESAAAMRSHLDRLRKAQAVGDLSDVVGCAKELAESVARVVLAARGKVVGDSVSFKELITEAHRSVDRQPGEGLATEPSVRKMAQSAKGLVVELGQLRNDVGTGHGRASVPEVIEEHADLASDAVTIWARWVLRRLPAFIQSDLDELIRMLASATFYKGTLRSRLEAIGLSDLNANDARSMGVVIGRRTIRGTFMVRAEGVDPVLTEPGLFSSPFRSGLIQGMLFDVNGAVSTTVSGVSLVVDLLLVDDKLQARLNEITPMLTTGGWFAPHLFPPPTFETVSAEALRAAHRFPSEDREQWRTAWIR